MSNARLRVALCEAVIAALARISKLAGDVLYQLQLALLDLAQLQNIKRQCLSSVQKTENVPGDGCPTREVFLIICAYLCQSAIGSDIEQYIS